MQIPEAILANFDKTHTPKEIDKIVISFCKSIATDAPRYITIHPQEECRYDECFYNVEDHVKRYRGLPVFGWKIWIWPGVFIEAEFHCVWRDTNNNLIDITPARGSETTFLFLPDSNNKFQNKRVDNIRKNISDNKLVDLFIRVAETRFLLYEKFAPLSADSPDLKRDEAYHYQQLEHHGSILYTMLYHGATMNTKCLCGSTSKFKHCCAKELINYLNWINAHIFCR